MSDLVEIRWHARAGQGAKTAAHLLAMGFMRSGSYAQAFPEYGPERRGAPLRAFTRAASAPIRRHDSVTEPDLVVVLEPTVMHEVDVADGLSEGGRLLVADERLDGKNVNLAMLGAAARALGRPSLDDLEIAAVDVLGGKVQRERVRAALAEGYEWAS